MGVDALAKTSDEAGQVALEQALHAHGLNVNLRKCGVDAWKHVFEVCTGERVIDWEWSTAPSELVKKWDAMTAKFVQGNGGVLVLSKYLSICVEHDACIEFC